MEAIADFTPDDTFTIALYRAIMTYGAGHKPRVVTRRPTEQRGQRLPGVYATPRGLYARFMRHIDGKLTCFYVATGTMGDYSKQEEERLHILWLEASATWDRGER